MATKLDLNHLMVLNLDINEISKDKYEEVNPSKDLAQNKLNSKAKLIQLIEQS